MRFMQDSIMMDGKTAGRAKVGVGLRVIANIHTKKAGLNLNGLFPIGFNASTDALSGDLEVKTIGLNSDQISKLITTDRKSTRLNSSNYCASRMPSSASKEQTHK